MSFAFRRVSSMRKVMWASLAINLFLAGALAGNLVSGFSMFHFFMPPPPPPAATCRSPLPHRRRRSQRRCLCRRRRMRPRPHDRR